jgi:hypothetical protein
VTAAETDIRQKIQALQDQLAHADSEQWRELVREINVWILRLKTLPLVGT